MIRAFTPQQRRNVRHLSRTLGGRAHLSTMLDTHRAALGSLDNLIEKGADTPQVVADRKAVLANIATIERFLGTVRA